MACLAGKQVVSHEVQELNRNGEGWGRRGGGGIGKTAMEGQDWGKDDIIRPSLSQ